MKKTALLLIQLVIAGIARANHWEPNSSQFSSYMTVTSVVQIDGVEQTTTQLELGSFCNGEVRGSKYAQAAPNGRYIFRLPCWGNAGDVFTFKLYDAEHDLELDNLTCELTLVYDGNGYGGASNPYVISFNTSTIHNTTTGDWSDPNTWGGTVPGPEATVELGADLTIGDGLPATITVANLTIPSAYTLTIEAGSTLIVTGDLVNTDETGLIIEDGAQLINTSADVKATAKKNVTSYNAKATDGWYTIASPVDKMTIAGSSFLTETYDLYRYVESNMQQNEWENYRAHTSEFTIFENGRGYLYANSNSFSPEFVGTLNNAAVTYALTCTNRPDDLDGFNLIGNPFPHNIYKGAGGAIDNANLASGFYTLTNSGAWETHTFEDAILPEQGILVKTTQAGNLTITKTNAASTAESSAKNIAGRIRLNVEGTTGEDRAFVYFSEGTGLQKMPNFSETAPSLYVHNNGDFAITHASTDCESLDLMFKNNQSGSFTLGVDIQNLRFSYLHLIDRIAGTDTDLLQTPEYGFSATGNEYAARFQLVFKVMTGVEETVEEAPFAFVSGGQIIMNVTGNLQIVDMTGRVVFADKISGNVSTVGMTPGVYVLRLADGNSVKVQKIIIK